MPCPDAGFRYDPPVPIAAPSRDPRIAAAVARLVAGELVAFPTETVYGLGGDAANPRAINAIYALKGRPADHPLIVHVVDATALARWAREIPAPARELAARFWPGPLTLVLARAAQVLDAVTGGQDSIALRCPAHPLALELLAACREAGIHGLAAPSANRYGHVSPTTAAHVAEEFGDSLMVLDGGACAVGIESTIVELREGSVRVLRPGMLSGAELAAALERMPAVEAAAGAPRMPGTHAAHYAPRTPLALVEAPTLVAAVTEAEARGRRVAVYAPATALAAVARVGCLALQRAAPTGPPAYARDLYAALRALDTTGVDLIVVQAPPIAPEWIAIRDRLTRAAHGARA
jgi:L-threonylcarbamoyladenylate synthase